MNMVQIVCLSNSHNSESYRLVRFEVGQFYDRFGVGFRVAIKIYSESESGAGSRLKIYF